MSQVVKVSARGVWVPRLLIQAWGQVDEVEIEQRPDAIIIKPLGRAGPTRQQIIAEMRAAGLIEDLPWPRPRPVPAAEQARLARKLGDGRPLSEIILDEREEPA